MKIINLLLHLELELNNQKLIINLKSKTMKTFLKVMLIVTVVMIGMFILAVNGASDEPEKELTTQEQIEELQYKIERVENAHDADALLSFYNENEIKADDQFKNKNTYVIGKVNKIGKDIMDNPYITLGGGGYKMASVQCMFDENKNKQLAQLKKGQVVIVKGKCTGKMMYVMLDNCILQNATMLKEQLKELELKQDSL